jgi:MinD-like ATPase involved in chromosome partitioning or flagellar assembly
MRLRIATLAGDPEREASISGLLSDGEDVHLSLRCIDRAEVLAELRASDVDALVSVGAPGWLDAQVMSEARAGGVTVVGVVDNALEFERLASIGVRVLDEHASRSDIIAACRSENVPEPARRPPTPKGRVVAVWGPKGAPGRTTVAVELAMQFAMEEPATLLIDADPYGGDVVQVLGVTDELPTVMWAAGLAAKDELSRENLEESLRRVGRRGPVVLPGLPRADLWPEVSDFGWRGVLEAAADIYSQTVVDTGFCLERAELSYAGPSEGRNLMTRLTLATADRVVAVCRADPIGVKNFVWAARELFDVVDPDVVTIVLNRASTGKRGEINALLRGQLGRISALAIPDRPSEMRRAQTRGSAVTEHDPQGEIPSEIRELAALLGGRVRARGILARIAGKRS